MSPTKKPSKQARPAAKQTPKKANKPIRKSQAAPRQYERFHWLQRVAHALLLTTFTLLAITGLPQKYATTGWAQGMIGFFGGIETTRLIHHVSAVVLMLLAVYHTVDIGYKIFVRRIRLSMLPGIKDIKDAVQAFFYNLGINRNRPQMGRYTFEEKVEYWALIWGLLIMGLTGFMMWNPIATTKILSGEFIPAAKAAHGGEALLAVMAIVIWHMYGVHIRRFNKAMWTGKQTEEELLHEHPLELADIKAGLAERPVDPKALRKRRIIYYPVASILALLMLLGIYGFVSGEKTAITTISPFSTPVVAYVPQTPTPVPTSLPTSSSAAIPGGASTWDGSIGILLQSKCGLCHGASLATNGLSFATYADAIKGAQDGKVILPGDPANSKIIQIQQAGGHSVELSPDELALLTQWIAANAPEK
jgi:cytochrome b subunit of formate dehydrogenase